MAEALFARATNGRHEARSAGSAPAGAVHPEVVEAMRSWASSSRAACRRLEREDAEWADVVVTMGCGDACPFIPGKRYVDWELPDPAGKSVDAVRPIRDEIDVRIRALVDELDD